MSMAQVCCDTAVVVGAEAEARARARAGRRRRAAGDAATGRWKVAPEVPQGAEEAAAATRKRRAAGAEAGAAKRHGVASVAGRRREMEDAVSVREAFAAAPAEEEEEGKEPGKAGRDFYGVFDGHGCSHVADACRDRMHELVAEELPGAGASPDSWTTAMERSFSRMDAEVMAAGGRERDDSASCRCEAHKCDHVGSTAVVAVVEARRVVVSNCGDSRAVLCRDGAPVPLSSDHKPDRPDELERIESAGGRVIFWEGARVLGVLAMSRAIGDGYLKPFVSAVPEVTVTERLDGDECLILASDGLWDVVSNQTACDVARACLRRGRDRWCAEAAAMLTKMALTKGSSDNISVVVVDLRPRNPLPL
ncbi:probable protein phosphatase 2C 68 [Brachypodium distachyon]|uniref:probable protein phosphatase 2C 68 n=1 Tax=Brachypodium distachyon TaxID=15368 RepID=UPI0001C71008|nr:probable protein phosphatase 2C 68 [Brachypodium distachyon]|eukprot:XP_003577991.1 probable protein phosphatase 2C 68 [Brachypodium distachyon]